MPILRPYLFSILWAGSVLAQGTANSFRFPLDLPWQTTQSFNAWNGDWYGYHLGEDVVVSSELPVFAAGNGTVIHVGQHSGYGWVVVIQHSLPPGDPIGPSVATLYAHLRQTGITATGPVQKGNLIGYLSSNSKENGGYNFTHIHFAIKKLPLQTGCPQDDPASNWWVYAGYSSLFTVCNIQSTKIKTSPTDAQWPTYIPLHAAVVSRWVPPSDFINARQATSGTVIFSNYGPGNSVCMTCNWWDTGAHLPEQPYYRGMPFTVPSGTAFVLDSVNLTVFDSGVQYFPLGPATLIVSVNADSGGLPGTALEQFTFSNLNGSTYTSPTILTGSSVLHPTLSAGAQYWLTTAASSPTTMSVGWLFNNQGSTGLVAWHAGVTPWTHPFGTVPQTLGTFRVVGTPKPALLAGSDKKPAVHASTKRPTSNP